MKFDIPHLGKDATSVFDSMHHSDEALAMMNNYYIGDFDPTLEQPIVSRHFHPSNIFSNVPR